VRGGARGGGGWSRGRPVAATIGEVPDGVGTGVGFRVSSALRLSLKMGNGSGQTGQDRSNGRKRGSLRPHLICPLHGLSIVKMFGSGGDTFLMVGSYGDDALFLLTLLMREICGDPDLRLRRTLNGRSHYWRSEVTHIEESN
jgi:hypothetical protein